MIISDYVSVDYSEKDQKEETDFIARIKNNLRNYGIQVDFIEVKTIEELRNSLEKFLKDNVIIFNWCEEVNQQENTGYLVTDFLEKEGYVFTGAGTHALKLSANREKLHEMLVNSDTRVPKRYSFSEGNVIKYPVIIKSKFFHGSFGITQKSVLTNYDEFRKVEKTVGDKDYYMEEYIGGREFTVAIIGSADFEVLPLMEYVYDKDLNQKYQIQDYASKWDQTSEAYTKIHAELAENVAQELVSEINVQALRAFRSIGDCGIARIEVRIDEHQTPFVIDVNPNPNFRPNTSLLKAALKAGYTEGTFVAKLCEYALKRDNLS